MPSHGRKERARNPPGDGGRKQRVSCPYGREERPKNRSEDRPLEFEVRIYKGKPKQRSEPKKVTTQEHRQECLCHQRQERGELEERELFRLMR